VDLAHARAKRNVKDHILIGSPFANKDLTHATCLGITLVSLHCFESPKRKFRNYSELTPRTGHITEKTD